MGVSGQCNAPAVFYPLEMTPGTHQIGGWVGFRAGLDTDDRGKSFASAGIQTPFIQSLDCDYTDWATSAFVMSKYQLFMF
jgi:hypothetical protein